MKFNFKKLKYLFLISLFHLLYGQLVFAQSIVPENVNFNAFLSDSSGNSLDGNYRMRFGIFIGGTRVWYGQYDVDVNDGYFNVLLGRPEQAGQALDPSSGAAISNASLPITPSHFAFATSATPVRVVLEIKNNVSFETISPAFDISSSFFAFKAQIADSVGGYEASQLAKINSSGNIISQDGTQSNRRKW